MYCDACITGRIITEEVPATFVYLYAQPEEEDQNNVPIVLVLYL